MSTQTGWTSRLDRFRFVQAAKKIVSQFSSHRCAMMGSSIAFYSAFSLAPTLLIVLLRARLVSLGLVMGLAFLLVVSLVMDFAIQSAGRALLGSTTLSVFATIAQLIFGFVLLTAGLAALINWLPDTHVANRPALVGGAASALLFMAGRHLFALYLEHAGTAGAFGAVGSLAVLTMWLLLRDRLPDRGRSHSPARSGDEDG